MVVINELDKFNKAISEHNVCVAKIGTSWCGPCKLVEENIKKIEKSYPDVYFINVDAEESDDIVDEYNVRNVPVVIVFKDGKCDSRTIGLQTEEQLKSRLTK